MSPLVGLCGRHLLRELAFVFEANGFRWVRLMKRLLRKTCHRVNRSTTKTLTEAECRSVRKQYRTILTQGRKERPKIPIRTKGTRERISKSDAHNLHERLAKHEESVLRFIGDPDVSFTNSAGEQKIRMAKVKIRCLDASAPAATPRYGAGSQAISTQWPYADTTRSLQSRSRSPETPQT